MDDVMTPEIQDLENRRKILQQGAGEEAARKRHKIGKMTARERVEALLDPGSFIEIGLWAAQKQTGFEAVDNRDLPGDGVITGMGTIYNRPVCVYSQDISILAGTMGTTHAKKIIRLLEKALKLKIPVVGIIDSGGVRVQDHVNGDSYNGYSSMFKLHTISSGVIPQIALMMGSCVAGAAYSPILHDFVFMVDKSSHMYIASPALVKAATSQEYTPEELGGASVHSKISGCCDVISQNDAECINDARKLISLLPLNNEDKPERKITEDTAERRAESLASIIPERQNASFNMYKIIENVVDEGQFFEIKKNFAKNIIVGLARLDGQSVGIVANNPMQKAGTLDINSADKEARFIRFCDAFNIPLVFFVDTPGYMPGKIQEHGGVIRHGAKVLYAVSEATVPKITVYIRKAFGGANPAMCNGPQGADLLLAWPSAEIALMGADGAVAILYGKEIAKSKDPKTARKEKMATYMEHFGEQPYHAAGCMRVEEIIDPRDTRPMLIKGLRMMQNKSEDRPFKKHGNIPL